MTAPAAALVGACRSRALSTAMALLLAAAPAAGAPEGRAFLSAYVARNSPDRLVDILRLRAATTDDTRLAAVAWGDPFARGRHTRWELEAQLVRHAGLQDHWEVNGAVVVRWMDFPWDRHLDTRVAFGDGLSYASTPPPIEPRGDIDDEEESARLLNYLMVEAEFVLPGERSWAAFLRVHHRSGIFGAFGDVEGGSNFIGLGMRRYFD